MAGLFFGSERSELKVRMECIIDAEEKTVKSLKKNSEAILETKASIEKLIQAITESTQAMEKLCPKPV